MRRSRSEQCIAAIIPLGHALRRGSSSLPEGCSSLRLACQRQACAAAKEARSLSRTHSASRAGSPLLFGLAPRGVFRASCVTARAVGSYPTFSPLPNRAALEDVSQVSLLDVTELRPAGGLFSVALSVTHCTASRLSRDAAR